MKIMKRWMAVVWLAGAVGVGAQTPMGFRGDGSGLFPQAKLPALDFKNGQGIAWRTPLPADGCSSPVLLGQTVVVTADPDRVMGLDAQSGKLLWQHQVGLVEEQLAPKTDNALRAAVQEFRTVPVNNQGAVKTKVQEILQTKTIRKDWCPGEFGWVLPSPVTDGQKVYVAFYGGVVAALDAHGQLSWRKAYPVARDGMREPRGIDGSPVLVDGVLVLSGRRGILGLDPATGALKYQGPPPPYASTPCLWRKEGKAYLVWANGLVMAAADGKVMLKASLEHLTDSSPVMAGDRLFVIFGNDHGVGDQQTAAYDLALKDGAVTMTAAWQGPAYLPGVPAEKQNKRPFTRISPVIFGEWVVAAVPGKVLWAQQIADGTLLVPMPEVLADGSPHAWQPSPVVIGQTLVVPEGWGRLTLLQLVGGKPVVQAVHALYEMPSKGKPTGPRLVASPLAAGNTVYLRTSKELIALR